MTTEELEAQKKTVENRIACIISDQRRDTARVYEEHWRHYGPLCDKLARLRHRHRNGAALIIEYLARVEELEVELDLIAQAGRIRRMIQLAKEINKIDGPTISIQIEARRLDSERATTIRAVIKGLSTEVEDLRRLEKTFPAREAELKRAIEAQGRVYRQFLENKVNGPAMLDALYEERDRLRAIKTVQHTVEKYEAAAAEFTKLCESMPPDLLAFLMKE
jgi:hypothetical protein